MLATLLLTSCKWNRQDFSSPQMLDGEENFCVQVIAPNYACNLYGSSDSAVNNLPMLGDTYRVQFVGDSAAEGLAILYPYQSGKLRKSGKDEMRYYANRRLFTPNKFTYRLRNIKQSDHELTFDIFYGKRMAERVRILADFSGMPSFTEQEETSTTLSDDSQNIYKRLLTLAMMNLRPNGCECGGTDQHALLRRTFLSNPDALPYVNHQESYGDQGCIFQADFEGNRRDLWIHGSRWMDYNQYHFTDTAIICYDGLSIPIGFLTPRQKQLLAKEISIQNNAPSKED